MIRLRIGKKRARTPWASFWAVAVLLLFAASLTGPNEEPLANQVVQAAPPSNGKAAKNKPEDVLRAKLDKQIKKEINFDPNTPLQDALSYIGDVYDLKIDIDGAAFQAKDPMMDVKSIPIKLPAIASVKLSSVLYLLLDQVDATFELRQNRLVVVPSKTKQGLSARLPPPSIALLAKLRLPTLRAIELDVSTPLREGLGYLSDLYQVTFVIDEKAFRKVDIQEVGYQPVRLSTPPFYSIGLTLKLLLQQLQATYRVHEDIVLIVPGTSDYTVGEEIELERGRHFAFWSFVRAGGEVLVENKLKTLQAEMTLGLLMAGLKDKDPIVRAHAAGALGEKGDAAASTVPVLVAALKDPDAIVHGMAASALGKIGDSAVPAVPAIAKTLKDDTRSVRRASVNALGQIGGDVHLPVAPLIESLSDADVAVRDRVVEALAQIGRQGVPELIGALKHQDHRVRRGAAESLGMIGLDAKAAQAMLLRLMALDEEPTVRKAAEQALQRIQSAK